MSCFQTKAGYVLVYQRRDQGTAGRTRTAAAAAGAATIGEPPLSNGGNHNSEDDMDIS